MWWLSHWLCPHKDESPAQRKEGATAAEKREPVWISCLYKTGVQSWEKWMRTICSSHFPLYTDFPLYEVHQIRRAATGEPTLWSRRGLVIVCSTVNNTVCSTVCSTECGTVHEINWRKKFILTTGSKLKKLQAWWKLEEIKVFFFKLLFLKLKSNKQKNFSSFVHLKIE